MRPSESYHNLYSTSIFICCMSRGCACSLTSNPLGQCNLQSEIEHGQIHHLNCQWNFTQLRFEASLSSTCQFMADMANLFFKCHRATHLNASVGFQREDFRVCTGNNVSTQLNHLLMLAIQLANIHAAIHFAAICMHNQGCAKSMMDQWLERAAQVLVHEMYCHDWEVVGLNPSWIKFGCMVLWGDCLSWRQNISYMQPYE